MRVVGAFRAHAREVASVVIVVGVVVSAATRLMPRHGSDDVAAARRDGSCIITVDSLAEPLGEAKLAVDELAVPGALREKPPWSGWVELDLKRLPLQSTSEDVRAVAARIPNGLVVAVYNGADAPIALKLAVRLRPGRYTADRMVFSEEVRRVERLQSCMASREGSVEKPGMLPPRAGAVYRFIDPAAAALRAYQRTRQHVAAVRTLNSTQYRRISSALSECPWLLTRLQASSRKPSTDMTLRSAHRGLLIVRHALALVNNAAGLRKVNESLADSLTADLESLEQSLSECSVAVMNLVVSSGVVDGEDGTQKATVTVYNAGGRTVNSVRLWVTGPEGCRIVPADAAVFRTLAPRQTVTASFAILASSSAASRSFVSHLDYQMLSAPAHLAIPVTGL